MGFLRHDTNDIVLDAVLTDKGREFLAKNDGSFSIVKFAMGDDEIDYTIIKQFGRNVGKEKIEKNTPVFEALTTTNLALKNKLVGISKPDLTYLSFLGNANAKISVVSMSSSSSVQDVKVIQSISDSIVIPSELINQVYRVTLDNRFLEVADDAPEDISSNNVASYLMTRDASLTTSGGSTLTLTLTMRSTISDTMFSTYGVAGSNTMIRTYVAVEGLQDGSVYQFEVQITNNTA